MGNLLGGWYDRTNQLTDERVVKNNEEVIEAYLGRGLKNKEAMA